MTHSIFAFLSFEAIKAPTFFAASMLLDFTSSFSSGDSVEAEARVTLFSSSIA